EPRFCVRDKHLSGLKPRTSITEPAHCPCAASVTGHHCNPRNNAATASGGDRPVSLSAVHADRYGPDRTIGLRHLHIDLQLALEIRGRRAAQLPGLRIELEP